MKKRTKPIRTAIGRPVRMAGISVTEAELEEIRVAAGRTGVAVAAFIRRAALAAARATD